MSGDPTPRPERRYLPPDHAATTEFAAPGTDSNAADPNATDPDPPDAPADVREEPADAPGDTAPTAPAPGDTAPGDTAPDGRGPREPEDVRVAPLHAPPAGRGRSGGTAELAGPSPTPPGPHAPPVRGRGGKVRGPAFALGTGVLVVAVALGAVFALGGDGEPADAPEATPTATPTATSTAGTPGGTGGGAAPAPTTGPSTTGPSTAVPEAPAAGAEPPLRGDGVAYRVVEDGPGYYEGSFVVTNRTGRPLTSWRLSFLAPGSDVRNAWGGRLVRGGERAVIENTPGAAAVPPMGTVTVRFGAAGEPAPPAECVVNGAGCGL
ncbi:cellulose binding domain-containing protein [Actinomadura sediminis]|uniref:Cellulose binding domain-containing protein n=1 Tax=Actinomadura sediminis TaxID=1038904 RepID=A0ABW3EZY5_9ACTN